MTISVLLADDHEAVRAGITMILESAADITVIGHAIDGADAIRQARRLRPDVMLMDVRMPTLDGLAATSQVINEALSAVIVLTTFDYDDYVDAALRAGASGFLLKTASGDRIVESVRAVAAGDAVLDPAITRLVVERYVAESPLSKVSDELPPGLADLTVRELEVLRALGSGLTNADIARSLSVELTTVKTHVSRVLGKLGLTSRVQAALLAGRLPD